MLAARSSWDHGLLCDSGEAAAPAECFASIATKSAAESEGGSPTQAWCMMVVMNDVPVLGICSQLRRCGRGSMRRCGSVHRRAVATAVASAGMTHVCVAVVGTWAGIGGAVTPASWRPFRIPAVSRGAVVGPARESLSV